MVNVHDNSHLGVNVLLQSIVTQLIDTLTYLPNRVFPESRLPLTLDLILLAVALYYLQALTEVLKGMRKHCAEVQRKLNL